MNGIGNVIANRIVSWRWPLLAMAVIAAVIAHPYSNSLQFDRSIEHMFVPSDPFMPPYQRLQERFGGSDVLLAVYVDPHLLHPGGSGIRRVKDVCKQLQAVPGVQETLSLSDIDRALVRLSPPSRGSQLFRRRKPKPGRSVVDPNNRLAIEFLDVFQGFLYGADQQTAAVLCILEPVDETDVPRDQTVRQLEQIVAEIPEVDVPGVIAGQPYMVVKGFELIELDGKRLGWSTTLLLMTTILLCFRSLRWVVIPIVVVQWTLLVTRGLLASCGMQLSMVSSMLTAIVTVAGIATMIHIMLRFRRAREKGLAPREAIVETGSELAAPIFFTCVTDAVGFGALLIARVGPVRDFGLMMAVGSLMVLVGVVTLVPGLVLLGRRDTDPQRAWGERRLDAGLGWLIQWVERRPALLGLSLAGILVLAIGGILRGEVETDFTKNFRKTHQLVRSYEFVEQRLGGAGVWDLMVPAPDVIDENFVAKLNAMEEDLRQIDVLSSVEDHPIAANEDSQDDLQDGRLTKVVSVADALQASEAHYALAKTPVEVRVSKLRKELPAFMRSLQTDQPIDGQHYSRIMLRAMERQPATEKLRLIERVGEVARQHFPQSKTGPHSQVEFGAEVTGPFVLMSHLISSMIRDQWVCFAAAALGIAGAMCFALRRGRLALIALVPNALPILLVLGGMGWLDLKINMGAAMIAAAAMGLSVDSSIHYLTHFVRDRREGLGISQAILSAQQTVGPAIVFSTLALVVGFLGLCTSEFVPTVYFGLLGGLSLLGGLFGNLLVLPLLIRAVERDA